MNFGLNRTTLGLSNFVNELKAEHLIKRQANFKDEIDPEFKRICEERFQAKEIGLDLLFTKMNARSRKRIFF